MATPHISGAMALLWSAIPSLKNQIDASRAAMNNAAHFISSTQCGAAGPPNNVYGWGRVDILAAVGGRDANANADSDGDANRERLHQPHPAPGSSGPLYLTAPETCLLLAMARLSMLEGVTIMAEPQRSATL